MPSSGRSLRRAALLGALHGPAELLPVSSSAHVELVPWLLRWDDEGDADVRKAFTVALHAGTAAALLVALRAEVGEATRGLDGRRVRLIAGSFVPPALIGLALERPIERSLSGPPTIAVGLVAGALAMVLADRAHPTRGARARDEAGWCDALALGFAQATALVPGVSRNGVTLAAARARGFGREDASVLSRHVALPVIGAASVLKGLRMLRRGVPQRAAFAVGTGAAFGSTLASTRLVNDRRPLAPYAAYRVALAGFVIRRLWQDRRG